MQHLGREPKLFRRYILAVISMLLVVDGRAHDQVDWYEVLAHMIKLIVMFILAQLLKLTSLVLCPNFQRVRPLCQAWRAWCQVFLPILFIKNSSFSILLSHDERNGLLVQT
jgi:hypothetical protein